jgi:hypothetical protein
VEFDERKLSRITVRPGGRSRIDKLYLNVTGQLVRQGEPLALLYSPELATTAQNLIDAQQSNNAHLVNINTDRLRLWGIDDQQIDDIRRTGKSITHLTVRSPISGRVIRKYQVEGEYVEEGARLYDVANLSTVWIEAQVYENQISLIKEGMTVSATTVAAPDRVFQGRVALMQPHLDAASRTLRVRFDMDNSSHDLRPGMFATVKLQSPVTGKIAEKDGKVLAVPEPAVIDTGSRRVVYRETNPGTYEGVEVKLGPRCDLYYPVLDGLKPGDRVVTAGSFLVDAETRLNPAAGSIYLGGSSGSKGGSSVVTARPSMIADESPKVKAALARLSPEDRRLAEAQGNCPVLGGPLGGMGTPFRLVLKGQVVFLCCPGCENEARQNEDKILAKVEQLKKRTLDSRPQSTEAGTPPSPPGPVAQTKPSDNKPAEPTLSAEEEADIHKALAKLSPEDRLLAQKQRFCPIAGSRLGSMGPPIKLMLQGHPVFLCCSGCRKETLADPEGTLRKLEKRN